MPPLYGALYADVVQTGTAVRRMQADGRFITTRMVPTLVVKKPSGLYKVYVQGDLNRDEMEARGPSAPTQKGGFRKVNRTFDTDARSLGYDLNDAEAAGSDVDENPEILIPILLAYKASIHLERRMASAFFGAAHPWYRTVTGAGANGAEGTTAMNRLYLDNATTDPVEAFTDEIRILSNRTGADPMEMSLTIGSALWHKVRNHAKVKAQISSTIGSGLITMARQAELPEFAKLLGIKACFVSTAIYNTKAWNQDATEEPTNTLIVPTDEALLVVNPKAGEENADPGMGLTTTPAAFARAVWNGVASDQGVQVRKFRDEKAGPGGSWSHVIDVYNGLLTVTANCGVIFRGMITP